MRKKSVLKTHNFEKSPSFDLIFVRRILPTENRVKWGWFFKILSFENRFFPHEAILWTRWDFLRIIEFIADILVPFPLASDRFLRIPPSRKITNNSGIYTYWGGNMSREGTARGKINNFSEAPRCIVFSKKRGHWCIHFLGKYWFFLKNMREWPYLK